MGFTIGGCISEVFHFWQKVSGLSGSLWFSLFTFYVYKSIETKGLAVIVLNCLPYAAGSFHLTHSHLLNFEIQLAFVFSIFGSNCRNFMRDSN